MQVAQAAHRYLLLATMLQLKAKAPGAPKTTNISMTAAYVDSYSKLNADLWWLAHRNLLFTMMNNSFRVFTAHIMTCL